MSRKFDPEEHIIGLNTLKSQLALTPFDSDTIRKGFKSCGIPSNNLFFSIFKKSDILKCIGEDLYCFINPNKPIHFTKLSEIYREYSKKSDIYRNRWHDKKNCKNLLSRSDIRDAIKLLKSNGIEIIIKRQGMYFSI